MKTLLRTTTLTASLAALLLAAGCSSRDAAYVDSKGPNTIVSLNQINIQDFNAAADDLVADLLASGVLERTPSKPAVMAVSRIVNNTQDNFDMDSLTKKIRIALYQSGKVLTTTTIAYGGSEDPLAAELGPKSQTAMPYYTLSGKIIQDTAKAGKVNQVTYTFQLSLTTIRDGLAVWEGEKQITKQGHKSAVGW